MRSNGFKELRQHTRIRDAIILRHGTIRIRNERSLTSRIVDDGWDLLLLQVADHLELPDICGHLAEGDQCNIRPITERFRVREHQNTQLVQECRLLRLQQPTEYEGISVPETVELRDVKLQAVRDYHDTVPESHQVAVAVLTIWYITQDNCTPIHLHVPHPPQSLGAPWRTRSCHPNVFLNDVYLILLRFIYFQLQLPVSVLMLLHESL